jgi:zinc transporter, ZIP family
MPALLPALVAAGLAGLATGAGALPLFLWDTLPRRAYDALLGVGAGLMLSAATLGLLGHALEGVRVDGELSVRHVLAIAVGFLAGAGLLFALDRFLPHLHAGGHPEHGDPDARLQGTMVVGAMTLHRIPEGFAIGAGFAHGGASLGMLLTVAVAFQNACEGVVMSAPLRKGGMARWRAFLLVTSTGFALPVAAVAGAALSTRPAALPFLLALAAGALIYVVSNEIIPESHSHGNEGTATLGLVLGFLGVVLLQALTGHGHA